ncbi:MAG: hypothetical protein ABR588_02335 [Sphingomicrobium sp.]|nr:hypothetical protein [Sphingomonadales bacterium]
MMTFGFTTLIDVLSWIVVFALTLKVGATLIILIGNKEMRDQPGWGSTLWWATKTTPIVAVPCLIWIAMLEGDASLAWLFLALGLFVIVAVPLKIRQRRNRIAKRMSAKSLARL